MNSADMHEPAFSTVRAPRATTLTYAYLSSAPHSGSTLLACLLGAHERVSSVGEFGRDVKLSARCSCGSIYSECEFWREWAERAEKKSVDFQLGNLQVNLEPDANDSQVADLFFRQFEWQFVDKLRDAAFALSSSWQNRWRSAVDRSVRLAAILCDYEETDVFFDTTKNPLQIRFLARHPDIRLKMISLFRDGRAVVNSLIKREGWSLQQSVNAWKWACRNQLRAAKHLPRSDVFHLQLEEFCRSPEKTLADLCSFLQISPMKLPSYLDPTSRHIVGNYMRHTFSGEVRPHDDLWRSELPAESIEYFERTAGWLNRELGYE